MVDRTSYMEIPKHMLLRNGPKVLFVNHSSKPAGAEFVLRNIVKAFHKPTVFLFEDGPFKALLEDQGTQVVLPKKTQDMSTVRRDSNLIKVAIPLIGSMVSIARQINKAARGCDVVYANSQKAFVLAAAASAVNRIPLIWHCHDILDKVHFSRAQIQLDVKLANMRTRRVFVPSVATGEAFSTAGGKESLVRVLYNGVAPLPEALTSVDATELRRGLGLPEGFLYGVFSRIAPWKGQHIAIAALQYLPDAKCVIVGDAQFGEYDYYTSLRDLAATLKVADRVIFLGHRSDVPTLMQAVDVYCHPSVAPEPFSLALLEAMRAGLPIVATATGGTPEVIKNGFTGSLCAANDPIALSAALRNQQQHLAAAKILGINAKQLVTDQFSVEKMQHHAYELVSEVCI